MKETHILAAVVTGISARTYIYENILRTDTHGVMYLISC